MPSMLYRLALRTPSKQIKGKSLNEFRQIGYERESKTDLLSVVLPFLISAFRKREGHDPGK